jgi:hypothetical protein
LLASDDTNVPGGEREHVDQLTGLIGEVTSAWARVELAVDAAKA